MLHLVYCYVGVIRIQDPQTSCGFMGFEPHTSVYDVDCLISGSLSRIRAIFQAKHEDRTIWKHWTIQSYDRYVCHIHPSIIITLAFNSLSIVPSNAEIISPHIFEVIVTRLKKFNQFRYYLYQK